MRWFWDGISTCHSASPLPTLMKYPEEGKKELPCMKRKRNGSLGPLQQSVTLKERGPPFVVYTDSHMLIYILATHTVPGSFDNIWLQASGLHLLRSRGHRVQMKKSCVPRRGSSLHCKVFHATCGRSTMKSGLVWKHKGKGPGGLPEKWTQDGSG